MHFLIKFILILQEYSIYFYKKIFFSIISKILIFILNEFFNKVESKRFN